MKSSDPPMRWYAYWLHSPYAASMQVACETHKHNVYFMDMTHNMPLMFNCAWCGESGMVDVWA